MSRLRAAIRALCPPPLLLAVRHVIALWRSRAFADPAKVQRALTETFPAWQQRIDDVLACPDNAAIPRVPSAGHVRDGWVVMHNGLEVGGLTYYGGGVLQMLARNKGVHEPQEERVFMEVLPHVEPGSAMLELGAYWGFYSLWFATSVPQGRSFIVEPLPLCMMAARTNFRHANRTATFERAYVGDPGSRSDDGTPFVTVDGFCARHGLSRLGILHADIQGAELEMLHGAQEMIDAAAIDYVFISTHSQPLHQGCVDWLRTHGYIIVASANLDETYSFDGLVVAKAPAAPGPSHVTISRRRKSVTCSPDSDTASSQPGHSSA